MDVLMDTALQHNLVVYFSHNFNQIPTSYTVTWITVFNLVISLPKCQKSWIRISSCPYEFNDKKIPLISSEYQLLTKHFNPILHNQQYTQALCQCETLVTTFWSRIHHTTNCH